MKTAEQVTFGGSGLNRAAEIRGDRDRLAVLRRDATARCLPVWRGKPLLCGEGFCELALLEMDHPVLTADYGGVLSEPMFLGLEDDGAPRFAVDLSGWSPEEVDLAALGAFFDPTEQHHPDLPDDTAFVELRRAMTRLGPRDAELAATAKAVIGWHGSHRFCSACGKESVVSQAGWQRDCPACGTHHFPRTDPVVIMLVTRGDTVLMGRSPNWPEGMYSLLAGFIEPGETMEAAVRREVFEEAGVRVGRVRYLASQPWPFPASLMFGCIGEALTQEITVDPKEIEDAMWVGRSEMMAAFAGEHPLLKPARKGAIAHFLLQNWLADTLD
ncbi:NAD(+) diphosphatase [Pseudodonghicola xiamenensis]|uniref:NAD(+) diphosphatase n=1 Tax=Pseudodonghicola xiamenensis TaxID=337702 RepID=A0A8J3H7L8_9RHOB|nr:NAD(+) diphosphatase [Pseudodonghicola xiamenensis]GHG88238.1 NADH pyrophosphatase [Pseudodonghicola xiamenensis]